MNTATSGDRPTPRNPFTAGAAPRWHSRCLALVMVVLLVACLGWILEALAQAPVPAAPVIVAQVIEQDQVDSSQTFVGTLSGARKSTVGSALDGRVAEFLVEEGDRVKKGDKLAQLQTKALEIQIAVATAELELRTQELKELENGARPEELDQALAHMQGAQALRDYTRSKFDRTKSLVERNAASTDQLQDDSAAAERGVQAYLEAKAAYDLVKAGPRPEKIAQARARQGMTQEQIHQLEDQLAKHSMYAPFDGYVVQESTEIGQWIMRGDPVVQIVELDYVDVQVPVLESYIPHLHVGDEAEVELDALPHRKFVGKITSIVPNADLRSRSFPVKVQLKNEILEDGTCLLKPGMTARLKLTVLESQQVRLIPKDALVLGGEQPQVFVLDPDSKGSKQGKVRRVNVEIGVAVGSLIQVGASLQTGELVVVEGNERLRPDQLAVILRQIDTAAITNDASPQALLGGSGQEPRPSANPTKTTRKKSKPSAD